MVGWDKCMRICKILVKPLYQTLLPDFLLHFLKQWKDSNHDIGYHSTGIANKKKPIVSLFKLQQAWWVSFISL
jgi:hypothetical protein